MCNNVDVADNSQAWARELAVRLGRSIAAARKAQGMSASKLAETTAWLGAPVHRIAVPRIERGDQIVSVTELVALGVALKTNWVAWLRDASEGLDVEGVHEEAVDLHVVLADLDRQLEGLRHSLRQAEEGPRQLNMPEALRERMIADAARYREMVDSLLSQRKMIESMLESPDA